MSNRGKSFDIKGFADAFGEAFDLRGFAEAFRSAFAVPPQFTPIGAISIGYDIEPPEHVSAIRERVRAMRKPLAQTVHRGRWDLPFTGQPTPGAWPTGE